jgi:hypothetical protein
MLMDEQVELKFINTKLKVEFKDKNSYFKYGKHGKYNIFVIG